MQKKNKKSGENPQDVIRLQRWDVRMKDGGQIITGSGVF